MTERHDIEVCNRLGAIGLFAFCQNQERAGLQTPGFSYFFYITLRPVAAFRPAQLTDMIPLAVGQVAWIELVCAHTANIPAILPDGQDFLAILSGLSLLTLRSITDCFASPVSIT